MHENCLLKELKYTLSQKMNLANVVTKSYVNVGHGGLPEEINQEEKGNLPSSQSDKWLGRSE